MRISTLRFPLLLTAALSGGTLMAADPEASAPEPGEAVEQAPQAIDEVISMHNAGVEPGVIIGYLRSLPDLPPLSAADLIELQERAVSPDVLSALVLMAEPQKGRLSADDIVQLHKSRVPSHIISEFIRRSGREQASAVAANPGAGTAAPEAAEKGNRKYVLAMPRTSSVIIIPHRPYYYSPYYRGYYHYPRYYGPTLSFGFGRGYNRSYCW